MAPDAGLVEVEMYHLPGILPQVLCWWEKGVYHLGLNLLHKVNQQT